jgi:hypothetical protein
MYRVHLHLYNYYYYYYYVAEYSFFHSSMHNCHSRRSARHYITIKVTSTSRILNSWEQEEKCMRASRFAVAQES